MIGSSATAAPVCRAVLPPRAADVFGLRNRAVGRHRKVKLGDWRQPWLRVAGAVLLVVSAGIHLDLYLTGYRSIPTIGWLFLVQFLVAFILAIGALVTHSRLVAIAAREADAAVALNPIMAAQRPSFPACPWSLCPTLPKVAVMRRRSG